ncbi:MAG TPA: hypothetical protein VKI41_01510 [Vicinamibacteria bacterium]|nr:hypothetical protein [Vicinamibacteria bacterium]
MTTVEAGITDAALYRRGNFIAAALARGLCLSLSLAIVLFLWNSHRSSSRAATNSLERLTERDPRPPVATAERLPKTIGPDSASVRGTVAS